MPFITLNNNWSSLAQYYNTTNNNGSFAGTAAVPNVTNTQKPTIPSTNYNSFDDGLIRGGVLNAGLSTARDVKRVGQFYVTGNGAAFIIKQVGLQRTNPKLEETANVVFDPTRTYNLGVNTLASVAGTAFGLHFDRSGLFPIIPNNQKYGGDINAPIAGVAWQNNFGTGYTSNLEITDASRNRLLSYTSKINNASREDQVNLLNYSGGPGSFYGIGRTRINTTNVRTTINDSDFNNQVLRNLLNGFTPLTSKKIDEQTSLTVSPTGSISLQSVIAVSPLYNSAGISNNNIETKLGVSTPNSVDSINIINIVDSKVFYEDNKGKKTSEAKTSLAGYLESKSPTGDFGKDLIKFRLEFLNNDTLGTVVNNNTIINTDVLAFRAYLDNFDDGMSAKWSSYRYMGRGEEFYVYDGFTRDIGVSFTMFAHTVDELFPLYKKLNYLLSTFTPDYSPQLKMRGNIGYLTVGDYIYRQPGVFTDIKVSGFFDGPWNVGLNRDNTDQKFKDLYNGNLGDGELPMMLKVGLSFKPIHTFLPRKSNRSGYVPFIGRDIIAYPTKESPTPANSNPGTTGTTV